MREYVLVGLVTIAVTYVLTPLARRLGLWVRALTAVRDRDVHAAPVPRLGGLAMYGGLLAGTLLASEMPHLQIVFERVSWKLLLVGAAAICLFGALDDRFGLDALTKFAGQIAVAGVLALGGVQLLWLPIPSGGALALGQVQGVLLTVFLVVLTVNAVNFVDGLDGLAAGIVGIAASAFFLYSYALAIDQGFDRQTVPALITAILAGMCVGFLPHNFNAARVFMGDSGSMLIGVLLAASTVTTTGQLDYTSVGALDLFPAVLPLLLPIAVLAVPFIDLLLAVVRRTRAGRSPFAPDKQHLHHRLLEIGHSHARAVLIMYCWAALLAFIAVAVALRVPLLALSFTASAVMILLLVLHVPRLRHERHH